MTAERRPRRTRDNLREQLIESALVEFAAKGFDGASTRAIAERVDAHQPQINYHFASKEALWDAAVDHLFAQLYATIADGQLLDDLEPGPDLANALAAVLRRFVAFAAEHPELNRIMLHAATDDNDRLHRMLDLHVRSWYETTASTWARLRAAGIAAPVEPIGVYWIIVGAASLPFVNAAEVRALTGTEPTDREWVEQHADGIVALLLPGLQPSKPPARRRSTAR